MQTSNANEREQVLDQLVEYERRLGLAWTRGDVANQRLPVHQSMGFMENKTWCDSNFAPCSGVPGTPRTRTR